jgi:uncharacterized membrane protein YgaE (UPF0421/DUF939 family)
MVHRPAAGTLKFALILLLAVMIPSQIAVAIGGTYAGMAFGIAAGFTMAVTPFATTAQALGSAVLAAGLAAASSLADDTPWAIAALMLVAALLLALTNQHSAGLMTLAPAIVVIFGPAPLEFTWWEAFAYVLAGGIVGTLVIRLFKFEAEPQPVPSGVAWRHAIVLGVLSAAAMFWALANEIPHGYWVAITLVVALRPLPEQRAHILRDRLLGTLAGAVLAFVVILVLPLWAAALVAAVCLVLLATYSLGGSYFMQTLFLTPMLLIFATLGDEDKGITYTSERVFYTIVGVAIGAVAAVVLDRWDRAAG